MPTPNETKILRHTAQQMFDLVAYVNIQQLVSETPVQVRLEENEYQYFLYDVDCNECTILFGLQSFSGGDPDIYINYG